MDRNGKQMKPEATRLTKAQWCVIIAKLSKPNAPSKRVLGREFEVSKGAIHKVFKMMEIEEELPIDDKIQPIDTFVEYGMATDFKGFEALHITVVDIDNQLLCYDVQTEVRQMYDELWRLFWDVVVNINKLALNIKCEKFRHPQQMTLLDIFKQ